jgi:ATP-dependent RNA helicase DDX55/SPB4
VERLLKADDPNKKGFVRSIVVAPTKELAIQIYQVLKDLLAFHQPSAAYLAYKKVHSKDTMMFDIDEEEEKAARPPPGPYIIPQLLCGGRTKLPEDLATFSDINPNVLIATPRRLVEVLNSSRVIIKRHWFDLLVMDEADRLLDANFKADLSHILDSLPKERRTGLFSASVSAAVDELVRVGMRYPFKISAKVRSKNGTLDKKTPESLKLCYAIVKPTHKLPMLKKVLEQAKAQKTIVYVSTRAGVDYWDRILPSLLGVKVYPMHGDHKSEIRTKNLNRFTDATEPAILLTTDVLARGIDISDVDMVAQLDLPSQPKDFIHRCGRSGRAGKRGLAITFITQGNEEDYIRYLEVQGTKLEPYPNTNDRRYPRADYEKTRIARPRSEGFRFFCASLQQDHPLRHFQYQQN